MIDRRGAPSRTGRRTGSGMSERRSSRITMRVGAVLALSLVLGALIAPSASAESTFVPISGAGSTWSQVALDQWRKDVVKYGVKADYAGTGSTDGRTQFRNGTVDYALTETPYGLTTD